MEARLEELMRSSDAAMGRIDELRRRERELQAAHVAAEASVKAERCAADVSARRKETAQQVLAEAERNHAEHLRAAREASTLEGPSPQALALRREIDEVRRKVG